MSFLTPAIVAAYHAVTALSAVLVPVLGGAGPAAAIIVFTATVRLCLHPLNRAQMRTQTAAQQARAALAPAVAKLQRKHKNDPLRAQRETLELYRANGVKTAPGVLLGLVQVPVFIVVYRLFVSSRVGGHVNELLGDRLFGVGLGSHLAAAFHGTVQLGHLAVFGVLIAFLAALATWSSRRIRRAGAARLVGYLPYTTVLGALVLPLASGLYVATTTLWTLVERRRMTAGGVAGDLTSPLG
ncbi:YidC/Oxa1 family membrane protein insertase [Catenulispora yoronensis]|uniref:Membrane protein insertase YidC n=1 Tax=Catenulispora yoronensis TaxID=450799 RepID=A0ABN2UQI8_9ACTN